MRLFNVGVRTTHSLRSKASLNEVCLNYCLKLINVAALIYSPSSNSNFSFQSKYHNLSQPDFFFFRKSQHNLLVFLSFYLSLLQYIHINNTKHNFKTF
jgi:hypothetical protein